MSVSSYRGRSPRHIRLGHPLAVCAMLAFGSLAAIATPGCSPAVPPAPAAKPVAVHTDHDHDHDKQAPKDSHDHSEHADQDHGDHDHAHPETLAAGVAELETMWGHVKESLKAGDREKADDKVHAVGHLLEDFEGLVSKQEAGLQDAGKQATQVVFECFDALDAALHGGEEELKKIDIDELGTRLEAAIESLKNLGKGGAQ